MFLVVYSLTHAARGSPELTANINHLIQINKAIDIIALIILAVANFRISKKFC